MGDDAVMVVFRDIRASVVIPFDAVMVVLQYLISVIPHFDIADDAVMVVFQSNRLRHFISPLRLHYISIRQYSAILWFTMQKSWHFIDLNETPPMLLFCECQNRKEPFAVLRH